MVKDEVVEEAEEEVLATSLSLRKALIFFRLRYFFPSGDIYSENFLPLLTPDWRVYVIFSHPGGRLKVVDDDDVEFKDFEVGIIIGPASALDNPPDSEGVISTEGAACAPAGNAFACNTAATADGSFGGRTSALTPTAVVGSDPVTRAVASRAEGPKAASNAASRESNVEPSGDVYDMRIIDEVAQVGQIHISSGML